MIDDEMIDEMIRSQDAITAAVRERLEVQYLRGLRDGMADPVAFAVDPHDPLGADLIGAAYGRAKREEALAMRHGDGRTPVVFWPAALDRARSIVAASPEGPRLFAGLFRPASPGWFRAVVIAWGHRVYQERTVPSREVIAEWTGPGSGPETPTPAGGE
jgi:hypothetical protein